MEVVLIVALVLVVCFGFVVMFGAPYLPTLKPQIKDMIKLADLKEGSKLLELGCGDGRILIAAAKMGISSVGYELNPILYIISKIRSLRYRKYVKVVFGNFWNKKWPESDVIFVFLLEKYMKKLDKKCIQYPYKPLKLVSFAFQIPNKQADQEKNGLFVYDYS